MRSVAASEPSDVTARARIRDAAVRRFGADGFGAPVRAIAADAGVSPGLVIHHFGSKEALRAACDEHVLRVLREAKTESLVKAAPADMITQLATVDDYAPLVGYLMQALFAGGDLATAFLDRLVDGRRRLPARGGRRGAGASQPGRGGADPVPRPRRRRRPARPPAAPPARGRRLPGDAAGVPRPQRPARCWSSTPRACSPTAACSTPISRRGSPGPARRRPPRHTLRLPSARHRCPRPRPCRCAA